MASILRGKLHESLKMDAPNPDGAGGKSGKIVKCQSDTYQTTAQAVAKQTGVSAETVNREAKLVRALKKLVIPEADYIAGKVLDDKGKKRSRGRHFQLAAKNTTGEVLPSDGFVTTRAEGRQIVHPDSQARRAKTNGVSIVTQKKLDKLPPELRARVAAGADHVSGSD